MVRVSRSGESRDVRLGGANRPGSTERGVSIKKRRLSIKKR